MNKKTEIRLLIIDDDEDDYLITSEYISRITSVKFLTHWCANYEKAIGEMKAAKYDIYLVDYRLGAKTGVDFLKEAHLAQCEEPIILLTGKGNISVDIEAMQLGAVDYLIKSEIGTDALERSLRYALDRAADTKAIKASERKYKNIFEQSKDFIFITDDQLRFTEVNPAGAELLEYKIHELLQLTFTDLLVQKQQKELIVNLLDNDREVNDWELLLKTKKGKLLVCNVTILAEKEDAENRKVKYHGIVHDISTQKKIEKANLQFEKLAAFGRLVRTLAHEVRNPLNNITLSTEQLKENMDEEGQLYIDIIQRNSKRISDLISELLNSSKPSEIVMETVALQNICDEVIGMSVDRLTLKNMKLQVDMPKTTIYIQADRQKLIIALLNIVINAIEAMEENKGILKLSLIQQDSYISSVNITDNGYGISEENITKLFEPYFTQKRNGMGLGLASTLNIIQAHNATIDVNSQVGKGSTFSIYFQTATA